MLTAVGFMLVQAVSFVLNVVPRGAVFLISTVAVDILMCHYFIAGGRS